MRKSENNFALIDGQNLHMATAKREIKPWVIDLKRFRVYLREKYDVIIEERRFKKVLLPDRKRASSLYKKIGSEYYDYLENLKTYITAINKKGS